MLRISSLFSLWVLIGGNASMALQAKGHEPLQLGPGSNCSSTTF